jgi:hypothetical protein
MNSQFYLAGTARSPKTTEGEENKQSQKPLGHGERLTDNIAFYEMWNIG